MAPADAASDDSLVLERRWRRWALALLVGIGVLLVHGAWTVGPTYDEHFYVASGYAYWKEGDFALNREHPPLLKLLAGAPLLLFGDVRWPEGGTDLYNFPATFFYRENAGELRRNLFAARLPLCALTLVGCWALWRATRRSCGPRAALATLLLFGFHPAVLAHGRLAALDMGTAVLMFLAAEAFLRQAEEPGGRRLLAAAVFFGLAALTKLTALLLVPLFALLALVACVRRRSWRPVGALALTFAGGLGVFAAGYRFEARAWNAAWGEPAYVSASGERPAEPSPAELAEALRRALGGTPASPARVERVASAAGTELALDKLAEYLETGEEPLASASREVLEDLAGNSARKLAFEDLLRATSLDPGVRLELLRRVSRMELADVEAARAWWSRNAGESWERQLFGSGWLGSGLRAVFGGQRPIPLFSALQGLDHQLLHSGAGHLSYFRGEVLRQEDLAAGNPHPEYYATVLAIKSPPSFLALALVGLVLSALRRGTWTLPRALVHVGFPLAVFLVFSASRLLMGVKYLLPILPFLAILAALPAVRWPRLTLVLAALAALEGVLLQPHQLLYYNLLAGGPVRGPAISVVGDDWGQGIGDLARFHEQHRDAIARAGGLYYEPYSAGDPAAFGLERAHPVHPEARGIVAVHAVDYYRSGERYRWLRDYEPFLRLGWSIYLYDTRGGPPGRDPRPEWERERSEAASGPPGG